MRFDDFTRSASFNSAVFDKIAASIAPLKIQPSDSLHIKDTERELHALAKSLDVQFITAEFKEYVNRQISIIDQNQEKTSRLLPTTPQDIVVDCTGTARAVLKSINAQHKDKPIFEFTTIEGNPHKTYASLRMYFTPEILHVSNRDAKAAQDLNPVSYVLAMEELRLLGWKSYAVPYCHHYMQPSESAKSDKKLEKYVLYFQMPEMNLNLERKSKEEKERIKAEANETAIRVTKILLKLFRNKPDDRSEPTVTLHKKSKHHPTKQIISIFNVEPYQTTPSCFKGDAEAPLTFHQGDSTLAAPFVMGQSFFYGIERTDGFFDSMIIHNGSILEIEYDEYDKDFSSKLSRQTGAVKDFFSTESKRIEDANRNARNLYILAYQMCKNSDDKEKIRAGLDQLNQQYLNDLHVIINFTLKEISDEITGFKSEKMSNEEIEKLFSTLTSFIKELTENRAYLNLEKNYALKESIYKMADCCKKAGNAFFSTKNYAKATNLYEKAIELYRLNSPQHQDNVKLLNLYSNLVQCHMKKMDYETAIHNIKLTEEEIIPKVNPEDSMNKKLIEKIHYNKANALIKQCSKYLEQKDYKTEIVKNFIDSINFSINKITSPSESLTLRNTLESLKARVPEILENSWVTLRVANKDGHDSS